MGATVCRFATATIEFMRAARSAIPEQSVPRDWREVEACLTAGVCRATETGASTQQKFHAAAATIEKNVHVKENPGARVERGAVYKVFTIKSSPASRA